MEDKKLNVFISQPMSSVSSEEIIDTRKRVKEKVKNYFQTDDLNFMESYFEVEGLKDVKCEALYWLSRSIEVLSNSDVIIMASGWEKCRGCRIEYECARLYDIMIIYEDTEYITSKKLFEVDSDSTSSN